MRVFITGGTGLIGTRLASQLITLGHQPLILTQNRAAAGSKVAKGVELIEGDPTVSGPWQETAGAADAIVNLAGENIFARRWNEEFRAKIRDSRLHATQNVVQAIRRSGKHMLLVNASAIGYYGPRGDEVLTEESSPGDDFLARVCVEWESAARSLPSSCRLVLTRIGVVLAPEAGALAQMLTPFKLGVGGPVGSGSQWMSWVHIADVVGIIVYALERDNFSGVINAVAPDPVTNRQFSKALGRALGRPSFFPVPVSMLRLRFGQVAEVISQGQRVIPRRTLDSGYAFRFSTIDAALADLLN
jgi:uncharacterized protein (TIGR01777 family)